MLKSKLKTYNVNCLALLQLLLLPQQLHRGKQHNLALLQLLLPLFIYALALWLPRRINPALRS